MTLIAKWGLIEGRPGKEGAKKEAPPVRGFRCCCVAEQPPTARYHYLQLLGTYLVATPRATTAAAMDCVVAVVLPAEVQAQSILPDRLEEAAKVNVLMYGEITIWLLRPNCGIAFVPS